MKPLYSIEIEPEVRDWLELLPAKHFLKVDEYVGLLAERATTLGEPLGRAVMTHSRWTRRNDCEAAEAEAVTETRQGIRLAMALAEAVYLRRTELGLTQTELAARAGLTQAKISRIEGSDAVPTLPLLAKLARALDASLNIAIDEDDAQVSFTPHTNAA
ncbi:helix-turn-helix transcriptional regulator [Nocardia sp. NPDC046473]|uniref:helix-turn-helix domain-containing protein n=1 Tax=Nocardia sp. NPDC046473 TaxID=3155733 RepID=UPI0033D73F6F